MIERTTPPNPLCPSCHEDGSDSAVLLVEHGYHMSRVVWDDTVSDWVTTPADWLHGWNGDETYWQCPSCSWQGDDPIGLNGED